MNLVPKQTLLRVVPVALLLFMACDPSSSSDTEKEVSQDTVVMQDTAVSDIPDTNSWDTTIYHSSFVVSSSSDTILQYSSTVSSSSHDTILHYSSSAGLSSSDTTVYSSSFYSSSSMDTVIEKYSVCKQESNCLNLALDSDKYFLRQNGPHRSFELDTACEAQCGVLKVAPGDTVRILTRIVTGDLPNFEWNDYSSNPYGHKTQHSADCYPWDDSEMCWEEYTIILNSTGSLDYDFFAKYESATTIYRAPHIVFQQE